MGSLLPFLPGIVLLLATACADVNGDDDKGDGSSLDARWSWHKPKNHVVPSPDSSDLEIPEPKPEQLSDARIGQYMGWRTLVNLEDKLGIQNTLVSSPEYVGPDPQDGEFEAHFGLPFADNQAILMNARIKEIYLRSTEIVCSGSGDYRRCESAIINMVAFGLADGRYLTHGGYDGDGETMTLTDDEAISIMRVYVDTYHTIVGIEITVTGNSGNRKIGAGITTDYFASIELEENEHLVGLHGAEGMITENPVLRRFVTSRISPSDDSDLPSTDPDNFYVSRLGIVTRYGPPVLPNMGASLALTAEEPASGAWIEAASEPVPAGNYMDYMMEAYNKIDYMYRYSSSSRFVKENQQGGFSNNEWGKYCRYHDSGHQNIRNAFLILDAKDNRSRDEGDYYSMAKGTTEELYCRWFDSCTAIFDPSGSQYDPSYQVETKSLPPSQAMRLSPHLNGSDKPWSNGDPGKKANPDYHSECLTYFPNAHE